MFIESKREGLPQAFLTIRDYETTGLPSAMPELVYSSGDSDTYFRVAELAWSERLNLSLLMEKLKIIVNEGIGNGTVKQWINEIAELRKLGIILESAYMLFDDSHFCHPEIYDLMRLFGRLRDGIDKKNKRKRKSLRVYQHLETHLSFFQHRLVFNPSSAEGYSNFYHKLLSEVKAYLSQDSLSLIDYHRLRKRIRRLMNAFQLAAVARPEKIEVVGIFQYLHSLDKNMGNYHDELLAEHGKDERGSLRVTIDEVIKRRIQSFLDLQDHQ